MIIVNVKDAGRLGFFRPIVEGCFQNQTIGHVRGYDGRGLKGFIVHGPCSFTRQNYHGTRGTLPLAAIPPAHPDNSQSIHVSAEKEGT
jgi:hypothetical protein